MVRLLTSWISLIGLCLWTSIAISQDAMPNMQVKKALLYHYHSQWALPQARLFDQQSQKLVNTFAQGCSSLPALRQAWLALLPPWVSQSAMVIGPILTRRSLPSIDFQPYRDKLLKRGLALQRQQSTPLDLNQLIPIGTPGKGIPTLEKLVFSSSLHTNECRYATALATEIAAEAAALVQEWSDWEGTIEAPTAATWNEFVNAWVGSIERLRWYKIEKPLRAQHPLPRSISGATGTDWQTHWQAIAAVSVGGAAAPHQSIAWLLDEIGKRDLAKQLRQHTTTVDRLITQAYAGSQSDRLAAANALQTLKIYAETHIADALDVAVGFSDADGD